MDKCVGNSHGIVFGERELGPLGTSMVATMLTTVGGTTRANTTATPCGTGTTSTIATITCRPASPRRPRFSISGAAQLSHFSFHCSQP
jgi:hypothetical protein